MTPLRHNFAGLVPEMLIRSIRQSRCVLFAGSGLSAQALSEGGARPPTWPGLLERMIDWCTAHRVPLRAEPAELREVLARGKLLVVAQELQQSLGGQLPSCLSDILRAGVVRPGEAHRLICETAWVAALSSNYDGLIEGAYALKSGGIVPPVFSPDGLSQALECLRSGRFFVFKVHGDLNLPGSIVLSNRDYARLLHLSPAYRSFLETLFSAYTVLFIGFGGNDPDLDGVIDKLSTLYERSIGQHFILLPEDEFSALERRRMLEDKRLDCITYRADADHSQVVEFLRALAARSGPGGDVEDPFSSGAEGARVFISGSYQRLPLLRQVADAANRAGLAAWFAETQISPGDSITDVVAKAIDGTDVFVVVLTDDAAVSPWVRFEIERALGARKAVLPLRVGGGRVPPDLHGILYLQVAGPLLTPSDEEQLVRAIQRLLARARNS